RNLLISQAAKARSLIPKSWDVPPRADGVYTPGGGPVQRWQRGMDVDLHLMIFGDSTATGYGCRIADEVPGVLIARRLAAATGKRVRLSTKAIVGATSNGLSGQVVATVDNRRPRGRGPPLPRFRCRQGDPTAAALDGAHPGTAAGPRSGCGIA